MADLAAGSDAQMRGCGELAGPLAEARQAWARAGGEASLGGPDLRCVLPLADGRTWAWQVRDRISPLVIYQGLVFWPS